jgi:hypothetical protein
MPFKLPNLREIPTVWSALRWRLEDRGGPDDDRSLLVKARLCGLLSADGSRNWRVDGRMLERLLASALKQLPRDPVVVGKVLHGLGEMDARTHASIVKPLIERLRGRRPRSSLFEVLSAAADCEAKSPNQPSLAAIELAQWVGRASLNWADFDQAVHRAGRFSYDVNPGRYGLTFVARIVAANDPRAIDAWILKHRMKQVRVATIVAAMSASANDIGAIDRAASLLSSGIPALKCLAAAFFVSSPFPQAAKSSDHRDCVKILLDGGINQSDATWMMAYRLKNAIHDRYWAESQLAQSQARLQHLELNPQDAVGGTHNLVAEKDMCRNRAAHFGARLSELATEIEDILCVLALRWPTDGLSEQQMQSVECNFVSTPEIRHRLAEKLPLGADRDSLLKRNIEQLRIFIGLGQEAKALEEHYSPEDGRFVVVATWAAQSFIRLYERDEKGVGKRTRRSIP